MSELNNILSSFESKFSSIKNKEDLQNLKSEFFGKNGSISLQFKKMGSLNPEERKNFAKELNTIKDQLTSKIEKKFKEFENLEINQKLKDEKVDITLPIRPIQQGKIHPVSQVIDEISSIFSEVGFSVAVSYTHLTLPTKA